ncbi:MULTISPECIES: hypothetical protein [Frankia]|uniref:hypothetical protein n=1 Tax=Frankia TaxID=1854 RepID=UPI000FF88D57|nr:MULTISPECIES: hypothetical protein [Frankia]
MSTEPTARPAWRLRRRCVARRCSRRLRRVAASTSRAIIQAGGSTVIARHDFACARVNGSLTPAVRIALATTRTCNPSVPATRIEQSARSAPAGQGP